jgi:hypothetical protein
LKTNKSMPAGLEVLCPKCKTFFKVPAGGAAPVAVVAGAASSSANGSIAAGRPSGVAPTHISAAKSRTSVRADDGRDSSETKPPDQKFKLAIAAGIVLLLAVAVCLVVWITSDRAGSPSDGSNADNKTKATNKGKDPDEGGDGNISLKADNQGEKKPPQETTLSKLTPEEKARVEGMKARALGWFKAMQDGSGSWPAWRGWPCSNARFLPRTRPCRRPRKAYAGLLPTKRKRPSRNLIPFVSPFCFSTNWVMPRTTP